MRSLFLFFLISLLLGSFAFAQKAYAPAKTTRCVGFTKTLPLRDLPPFIPNSINDGWKDSVIPNKEAFPNNRTPLPNSLPVDGDPIVQKTNGIDNAASITLNFEGISNILGFYPPDTQGDVGMTHYIQMVNSNFAVWTKTGTLVYGPVNNNTLWNNLPGPWSTSNDGDPIVLYDQYAGRWLMSQFALPNLPYGPFYEMVAVSASEDPLGAWYLYAFEFADMPDYPKFGIWSDGYYLSVNSYTAGSMGWGGTALAVLERDAMIAGDPNAQMVFFQMGPNDDAFSFMPADADGQTLPPAGTPGYAFYFSDDQFNGGVDKLVVYTCSVNWTTPASSSLAFSQDLPVQPFDSRLCMANRGQCIDQPGAIYPKLEALADRLMYRAQYRNFGTHQSVVLNHSVDVNTVGLAGIRWYELRRTNGNWIVYQQGTYSPTPDHHWMGSIAMDGSGNIALGYSVSGYISNPSIRFAGRFSDAPLGTLNVMETSIIEGGGAQTGGAARWGDYSMMSVDPADDATFWYTNEYMPTMSFNSWQTRIAAFSFETDAFPPDQITDLAAFNPASQSVSLSWTAVGDDGMTGNASFYDIRYTDFGPITDDNFDLATPVSNIPAPIAPGEVDTLVVRNLNFNTTYYFAIRVFDNGGNYTLSNSPVATTLGIPNIVTGPEVLRDTVLINNHKTIYLNITNTGEGILEFSFPDFAAKKLLRDYQNQFDDFVIPDRDIPKDGFDDRTGPPVILGAGGPDTYGYTWIDSDEFGGPNYNWVEISSIGTALSLTDDSYQQVALPFAFTFYGVEKNTAYVSSNGFVTFGTNGRTAYNNASIPSAIAPNDFIALIWDDLDLTAGGNVYYYYDQLHDRFIIQYNNVPRRASGGPYTAEIILNKSGVIQLQYKTLSGTRLNEVTVGIENAEGNDGLRIAYNTQYIHNELAVRIAVEPEIITAVYPIQGALPADSSISIAVTLDATGAFPEDYTRVLTLSNNDPDNLEVLIPVEVHVPGYGISIPLIEGWNIISSPYIPEVQTVMAVMQSFMSSNDLRKLQDEKGRSLEPIESVGWINSIPNWSWTEGYHLNTTGYRNLDIPGTLVAPPFTIPFTTGWNIMGYPVNAPQNALSAVQPLIDQGKLVRVIDEAGNTIENVAGTGWVNYIGDFYPGKGYLIKVNSTASLTLTGADASPKPERTIYAIESGSVSKHFRSIVKGNPFQTMSIYLTQLEPALAGYEIAAYDGDMCVGTAVIGESGIVLIRAAIDDPLTAAKDGFTTGNSITLKYWNGDSESILKTNIVASDGVDSDMRFTPMASVTLCLSECVEENVQIPSAFRLYENYPNPFNPSTVISYALPLESKVTIRVYTMLGEYVRELVSGVQTPGVHEVSFNASDLSSGMYLYRIEAVPVEGGMSFNDTKKMILMK